MLRYVFDTRDGHPHLDQIGEDGHDAKEGLEIAEELARCFQHYLESDGRLVVSVTDHEGRALYSIEIIGRKV